MSVLNRVVSILEDLIVEVEKESEVDFEMIEVKEILEETLDNVRALE